MVATAHIGEMLLLLSLIKTGVDGEEALTSADRGYDITFPCEEDFVCFHVWRSSSSRSQKIAIISNGEIKRLKSKEESCTLRMEHPTTENVGLHRCKERSNGFSTYKTYISAPELKLLPNKTVSLQCVLLSFVEKTHCCNNRQQGISLKWVDGAGAEIQTDAQHQITQWSCCDTTLTVAFQSPENLKFRCQATVGERVLTSEELLVKAPAPKGKGRGLVIDPQPENQGRNRDVIGAVVAVAGCVVLSAAVAVFVLNRRRTNIQLSEEPCSDKSSTINVVNTDNVIYADIIFPSGSDRVWNHDCESTEYSFVQYK